MGFLAPALPWISKGAAIVGGFLGGRKAQSSAQKRSPEEAMAMQGAQGAAGDLSQQGHTLTNTGLPAVNSATNYWQTLLGGNRAAMGVATAAPRAAITDQYRGAERGLERSGVRGGVRDLLKGEMSRDRAGDTARLTTGVQPMAAEQLGTLGSNVLGQGTNALGNAGNLWGGLLGEGFRNRVYARQEGEHAGGSLGSMIFDILGGLGGKKKIKLPGSLPGIGGPIPGLPNIPGPF